MYIYGGGSRVRVKANSRISFIIYRLDLSVYGQVRVS